jgi:hypothetical protein
MKIVLQILNGHMKVFYLIFNLFLFIIYFLLFFFIFFYFLGSGYKKDSKEAQEFFCGSLCFKVKEIEVYQLN